MFSSQSRGELFAKSTLFRIITVGITVMGKQSHITDSTERGTSDSYCDKLSILS